jgi:hypothetical protein
MPAADDPRLAAALAAIDDANAADPEQLEVDGVARPKELVHAERVTAWLDRLVDDPAPEQRIAARAHHLRRWELPRAEYAEGRAGYLRWRTEQKRRHAAAVGEILAEVGYDEAFVDRVGAIIAKRGLGSDPMVQAHEDALCLVFVELQFDGVAERLGDDHTVEVVAKTLRKMSPAAITLAAALPLSARAGAILERAVAALD